MAVSASVMSARRGKLRDNFRNRSRIAAAFRQAASRGEFERLPFGGYFRLADAVCDAAKEAKDDELDQFISDCCEGGDGGGFAMFEAKVSEKVGGPFIDLITQLLPVLLPLIIGCFG